jgi:hypothetical protein
VIWTKEIIAFARVGECTIIDAVPLSEVKSIETVLTQDAVSNLHLDGLDIEKNTEISRTEPNSDKSKFSRIGSFISLDR